MKNFRKILKEHGVSTKIVDNSLFASNDDGSGNFTDVSNYTASQLQSWLGY